MDWYKWEWFNGQLTAKGILAGILWVVVPVSLALLGIPVAIQAIVFVFYLITLDMH